jgi:DNA-binding response OmpR family regulator
VTKPFGRQELLARVENLLRRRPSAAAVARSDVDSDGAVRVDHDQRRATAGDAEIPLTPREFALLAAFVRNCNQVLSGDQIIEHVWGVPYVEPDQVKILVGRLRRKLLDHGADAPIETVRGFGYRYRPPAG